MGFWGFDALSRLQLSVAAEVSEVYDRVVCSNFSLLPSERIQLSLVAQVELRLGQFLWAHLRPGHALLLCSHFFPLNEHLLVLTDDTRLSTGRLRTNRRVSHAN